MLANLMRPVTALVDMQEQEKNHPKHILANVISCREEGWGAVGSERTTQQNKHH